jgi:hypothetical protein
MVFNELKIYLPKFLSDESEKVLYDEIKGFIKNSLNNRYYTTKLNDEHIIYQGDGLFELPIYDHGDKTTKKSRSIVISNTCDIDIANKRPLPINISFCPLIRLSKYKNLLLNKSGKTIEQVESHIDSIKRQEITQMFFLPKNDKLEEDSIALLDRPNNFINEQIERNNLNSSRIFTLSDFGAYLFLLKLSIHFTRIQDNVDRGTTH